MFTWGLLLRSASSLIAVYCQQALLSLPGVLINVNMAIIYGPGIDNISIYLYPKKHFYFYFILLFMNVLKQTLKNKVHFILFHILYFILCTC